MFLSLFWLLCVMFVQLGGARMCGESWLAVKDSLTHHPSSQGWASWYLLIIWPVLTCTCTSVCCMFPLFVRFVMVGDIYVLFVWSVYCVSCLSGLRGYMSGLPFFLPTSNIASVLCTCISTYIRQHNTRQI